MGLGSLLPRLLTTPDDLLPNHTPQRCANIHRSALAAAPAIGRSSSAPTSRDAISSNVKVTLLSTDATNRATNKAWTMEAVLKMRELGNFRVNEKLEVRKDQPKPHHATCCPPN